MCKPLFPLKFIFYKDNGEIEYVDFNNTEDISCNIEEYSDEDNKDNSFKIFDFMNREVYLKVNKHHQVKVLKLKRNN